jgi:hypothetical protein
MRPPVALDGRVLDGIAALWRKVRYAPGMPQGKIRAHIKWKYTKPRGGVYVERMADELVGTNGFLKTVLLTGLGPLECYWGVDALVDRKRAGSQMAFFKLTRWAFRTFRSCGSIVMAFPSTTTRQTFLNGLHRPVGRFVRYRCDLRQLSDKSLPGSRRKSDVALSWGSDFSVSGIDAFFKRVKGRFAVVSDHRSAYLQWRYGKCPTYRYFLLCARRKNVLDGFLVIRFAVDDGRPTCYVVDILCDPDDQKLMTDMLREVMDRCRSKKIARVVTAVSHGRFAAVFRALGFRRKKKEDLFLWTKNKQIVEFFEKNRAGLHFTMGDGDYDME